MTRANTSRARSPSRARASVGDGRRDANVTSIDAFAARARAMALANWMMESPMMTTNARAREWRATTRRRDDATTRRRDGGRARDTPRSRTNARMSASSSDVISRTSSGMLRMGARARGKKSDGDEENGSEAKARKAAADDEAFRSWLFASELPLMTRKGMKALSSLPLAIGELLVIAAFSALGTVIEQNKSYEWYVANYPTENPTLGFIDFPFILDLGLDHVYTTWYFLGLLGLLGASLTACTLTRQWPVWKVAAKWKFLERRAAVLAMDESEAVPRARLSDLNELLAQRGYQVFVQGKKMYAFKGLIGRLAPIGVHAALLFTLGGSAYSGLGGLSGSVMVPDGSSFEIESGLTRRSLFSSMPGIARSSVQVNDFTIDYLPNGQVSQFYSDLSVVDPKGNEMTRKKISVNVPLRAGGVTMYQTDWALSSMQVTVIKPSGDESVKDKENTYVLPMASLEGKSGFQGRIWGTFLPLDFEQDQRRGISIVARDFQSVAIYDSKGEFVGVRRPQSKKPIVVDGLSLVIGDVKGSTGLELKSDPGVPFVYVGFAGLLVTSFLSLLSHSQIWAIQEENAVVVGGKSNRAKEEFKTELEDVLNSIPEYVD